jgi:hypothetical protein
MVAFALYEKVKYSRIDAPPLAQIKKRPVKEK